MSHRSRLHLAWLRPSRVLPALGAALGLATSVACVPDDTPPIPDPSDGQLAVVTGSYDGEPLERVPASIVELAYGELTSRTRDDDPAFVLRSSESDGVSELAQGFVYVAPKRRSLEIDLGEIVLFDGADAAEDFFAEHGVDGTLELDVVLPTEDSSGDSLRDLGDLGYFLDQGAGGVVDLGDGSGDLSPSRTGDIDGYTDGDTSGDLDPAGGLIGGGPATVERWLIADDLPLRAAADPAAAVVMQLDQADRVFVQPTLPALTAGTNATAFVEVQVADRSPYPTGWVPIHWLAQVPPQDASDSLTVRARYGLVAKQLAKMVGEVFYHGCDDHPLYRHSLFTPVPSVVDGSIPAARRYQCGEYPVGDIYSSTRKRVFETVVTTPEQLFELGELTLGIASIDLDIAADMLRLSSQSRRDHYVKHDLANALHSPDTASDIRVDSRFPGYETDPKVRIHDSDLWFNVSQQAPMGVQAGADAYFNACMRLPGGAIRADVIPLSLGIVLPASTVHLTGLDPGGVSFDDLEVCLTASIEEPQGDLGDLVTEERPPVVVRFLKASIKSVRLRVTDWPKLIHDADTLLGQGAVLAIETFMQAALEMTTNPVIFQLFLDGPLEEKLAAVVHGFGPKVTQALPDPERWLGQACERMLGIYDDPASPYYPLFLQCEKATNPAQVTPLSAFSPNANCHDPSLFARVEDGRQWQSDASEHGYFVYGGGPSDRFTIDRPQWVDACSVGADIDTTTLVEFWPVVDCVAEVAERDINYDLGPAALGAHLQQECLIPVVKTLCDLYGDGDDLTSMWVSALDPGIDPPDLGAHGFCNLYDELTGDDGGDLILE